MSACTVYTTTAMNLLLCCLFRLRGATNKKKTKYIARPRTSVLFLQSQKQRKHFKLYFFCVCNELHNSSLLGNINFSSLKLLSTVTVVACIRTYRNKKFYNLTFIFFPLRTVLQFTKPTFCVAYNFIHNIHNIQTVLQIILLTCSSPFRGKGIPQLLPTSSVPCSSHPDRSSYSFQAIRPPAPLPRCPSLAVILLLFYSCLLLGVHLWLQMCPLHF